MIQNRNNDDIKRVKELCITQASSDVEQLLKIIGDLGYVGYRISLCKLYGYSYKQCAIRYGVRRSHAQKYFEKCTRLGYSEDLKRIFRINNN